MHPSDAVLIMFMCLFFALMAYAFRFKIVWIWYSITKPNPITLVHELPGMIDHIVQFMYGDEWTEARSQIKWMVDVRVPELLSARQRHVDRHCRPGDNSDPLTVVMRSTPLIPPYSGKPMIATIVDLVTNLHRECVEQAGGWISPSATRDQIDRVYRYLTAAS